MRMLCTSAILCLCISTQVFAGEKIDLSKPMDFEFIDTPVRDAMRFFKQYTGVNIILSLPQNEKPKNFSMSAKKMRLDHALNWICRLNGLAYEVRDEAVFVTTKEQSAGPTVKKIYDLNPYRPVPKTTEGTPLRDFLQICLQPPGDAASIKYEAKDDRLITMLPRKSQTELRQILERIKEAQQELGKSKTPLLAEENGKKETPAWETEIRKKLKQKIDMDVEDVPISTVAEFLSLKLGVNIILGSSINTETPVTFSTKEMSGYRICGWICKLLSMPNPSIRDGAVYLTKTYGTDNCLKLYDVTPQAGNRNLLKQIRKTIKPESWDLPGVAMMQWDGLLLVVQSPDAHRQLRSYLAGLRKKQ